MDNSRRRFFGIRTSGITAVRPPWSVAEPQFVDCCSRCDDCVRVCPTRLLARGAGGFPVADFSTAACTFCGECAKICSTGAIRIVPNQAPWSFAIRIGDDCLPRQGVDCRVCGEACEIGAIRFRLRAGGAALPEVDSEACTACGACIAPCPVTAIERIEKSAKPMAASVFPLTAESA